MGELRKRTISHTVSYDVVKTGVKPPPYPSKINDFTDYKQCERDMFYYFRLNSCKLDELMDVDDSMSGEREVSIEEVVKFLL